MVSIVTTSSHSQVTRSARMTDTEMAELFQEWWTSSYPTPPGSHAKMTHLGWGRYLLDQISRCGDQQPAEDRAT